MVEEKKIAGEMLTDEQLDGVAGGTQAQMESDTRFLREINAMSTQDGTHSDKPNDLEVAWAQMGVTIITNRDKQNTYFNNGKQISRMDALKLAAKKMKSKVDVLQYDI